MNPFEFVLWIIALAFLFKLLDGWLKHKHAGREAANDNELQGRLVELESRVRVLERIVTDERFDLQRQFKDLGA